MKYSLSKCSHVVATSPRYHNTPPCAHRQRSIVIAHRRLSHWATGKVTETPYGKSLPALESPASQLSNAPKITPCRPLPPLALPLGLGPPPTITCRSISAKTTINSSKGARLASSCLQPRPPCSRPTPARSPSPRTPPRPPTSARPASTSRTRRLKSRRAHPKW